jgi:hypothetical protein
MCHRYRIIVYERGVNEREGTGGKLGEGFGRRDRGRCTDRMLRFFEGGWGPSSERR